MVQGTSCDVGLLRGGIAIAYTFRLQAAAQHLESRVVLTPGRHIQVRGKQRPDFFLTRVQFQWLTAWQANCQAQHTTYTSKASRIEVNAETGCQNDMANMCQSRERLIQLPRYYFLSDTGVQVKLYTFYTSAHTQDSFERHVSHTFSNATQKNDKRHS
jgi:hypothetical protein